MDRQPNPLRIGQSVVEVPIGPLRPLVPDVGQTGQIPLPANRNEAPRTDTYIARALMCMNTVSKVNGSYGKSGTGSLVPSKVLKDSDSRSANKRTQHQ